VSSKDAKKSFGESPTVTPQSEASSSLSADQCGLSIRRQSATLHNTQQSLTATTAAEETATDAPITKYVWLTKCHKENQSS
jgi:hypothetical protein